MIDSHKATYTPHDLIIWCLQKCKVVRLYSIIIMQTFTCARIGIDCVKMTRSTRQRRAHFSMQQCPSIMNSKFDVYFSSSFGYVLWIWKLVKVPPFHMPHTHTLVQRASVRIPIWFAVINREQHKKDIPFFSHRRRQTGGEKK